MTYDLEKEKREAIDAGSRALRSLRAAQDNLNRAKEVARFKCVAALSATL